MLYKDVDKKLARQCCREHTVFNDKKHKEQVCDTCPLRRDFKDANGTIRRGICYFILMKGLTPDLINDSPYAQVEKELLNQEHVTYPLEWLEWLKTHNKDEGLVSLDTLEQIKERNRELAEEYVKKGEQDANQRENI